MPVFRVAGARVLFVHVPKSAGTSLEQMLAAHPACEAQGMYEHGPDNLMLAVGRCSPQHLQADLLQRLLRVEAFDLVFTVVRDPVGRLLSEHAMQRVKRQDTESAFGPWYARMQQLRQQDPFAMDNHLRPAWEFLLSSSTVYSYAAGLPAIWADLCQRLAIDPQASPLLHIRPCSGPKLDEAAIPTATRAQIQADYAGDWALLRLLEQRRRQGVLCCPAHELL